MKPCYFYLLYLLFVPDARADPFKADAQVAEPSPQAAKVNPANAASVRGIIFNAQPRIYEGDEFRIRYPGFKSITKEKSGVTNIQALSLGVGFGRFAVALTELLPPVGVDINLDGIPVVLFDQVQFINIKASAKVNFGIGGAAAMNINRRLALGIGVVYRSIDVTASVDAADSDSRLADLTVGISQLHLHTGARLAVIPGRITLGVASLAFAQEETAIAVDSPLLDGVGGDDGGDTADDPSADDTESAPAGPTTSMLKTVTFGALVTTSRLSVATDLQYTRANPNETALSIPDQFKTKAKDVHDTFALRAGMGIRLKPQQELVVGYAKIPSPIGQGATGEGTKAGFGLLDVVQIAAGQQELKPYDTYVVGMRFKGGAQKVREGSRQGKKGAKVKVKAKVRERQRSKWSLGVGLGYQRASLGIDENGEQPGAFLQTKLYLPLDVSYRF